MLSVTAMQILMSFLHFHGLSAAGFMLSVTEASPVANEFAAIPQVFSVNITTGRDNIYALVVAAHQPLLAELLVDTLQAVSGLNRFQSALLTQLFSGTRWRLGGLSPDQVRAVTPEPDQTHPPHGFDAL